MATSAPLKIAVVDDSRFYAEYLSRQLSTYEPYFTLEAQPVIDTFANVQDFLEGLDPQTNIAFLDYFLDHETTALEILPALRWMAPQCEVVILSQRPEVKSIIEDRDDSSLHFVLKDRETAMRSRLVLHELLSRYLLERQLIGK